MQLFVNNWSDALVGAISDTDTQMTVGTGAAALLVGMVNGNYYALTITDADETAHEVVHVTGKTAGLLDIVRGQEGTTALAWTSASIIEARLTAGGVSNLQQRSGWPHDVPTVLGAESLPTVSASFSAESVTGDDLEGINVYRFTPDRDIDVTALAYSINVTSGATSGDTISAVIYESGADGWPSDVLAQSSPEPLDAGIKKGATIGGTVTLKAGYCYWIGLHSSMANGAASATVSACVGHFPPMQWHLSAGYNFSTIWLDTIDDPGSAGSWPAPFDYAEHGSALGPVPVVGLITA